MLVYIKIKILVILVIKGDNKTKYYNTIKEVEIELHTDKDISNLRDKYIDIWTDIQKDIEKNKEIYKDLDD